MNTTRRMRLVQQSRAEMRTPIPLPARHDNKVNRRSWLRNCTREPNPARQVFRGAETRERRTFPEEGKVHEV